ncbi:MAG: glycosyltransferase family 4 protein [Deltaproteobacteria bacterium]|nr:glycosyltransferase family 4 protein [Deltaproteobacteria bacterium]
MRTRILLVSQLPPPVHGSTVMTQRFMEALAKAGFEVRMVERIFSRRQEDVGKVSLGKVMKIPPLCLRLLTAVLRYRPDLCVFFITVGFGSFLVDCLLLLILRLFRVEYVVYMHGIGLKKWTKESVLPERYLAQKVLSSALGGIVLGESLKDDVIDCIPDSRLAVVPNGIPDMAADSKEINSLSKCGEDPHRPVTLLFLANLLPSKGPLAFLQMARRVSAEEKNVRFILAGPPRSKQYADRLMDFIIRHKMQHLVTMPGGVYGKAKDRLFRKADIFVFPSSKEIFGIVNLEAMMWGLPVISSPIGAIPEIVIDEVTGYIIAPHDLEKLADRALKLIRDPKLRHSMGQKGRERYEKEYSITMFERKVKDTVDFFLSLKAELTK